MKRLLLPLFVLSGFVSLAQDWRSFKFETGDLLFQDLDCGTLCDANKSVGGAVNNRQFSHVGLAYVVVDSVWVIEAFEYDVHLTPLSEFLNRAKDVMGNPKVVVGRVPAAFQRLTGRAVGFALEQQDKIFDDELQPDNDKYYSSELVYDAYKAAYQDNPFFELVPMNFRDPKTNKPLPVWEKYFKEKRLKFADIKWGSTPGSIANDENIEIISYFY